MPEDRDQLFEQALARHLRAGAAAESVCLDPEMLAAYHERTLSPEEVASAKSHIVSCARCQRVLAQLEATATLDELHDTEQVDVPMLAAAGVTAQPHPQPASREPESSATRAVSSKVVTIPPKKFFSPRWVAPAGAIAAGLLIWISARESRINLKPSAPAASTPVAENRQQAVPSSDAENLKDLIPSKELEKQKPEPAFPGKLNETRKSPSVLLSPGLRDEKKDSGAASLSVPEEKSARTREYSRKSQIPPRPGPSAAAAQAQAADSIQRNDRAIVGSVTEQVEVTANAPANVPAPGDLDKGEAQKVSPAPAAKSAVTGAAAQPAAPPPPPSPSGAAGGPVQSVGAFAQHEVVTSADVARQATYNRAVSKVPFDIRIAAPGGKKIWSVGPNGQILFSKDSGLTWLVQFSGVPANLSGGSAPSDRVCWLVGTAGTVLRTTDSGNHWQVIRSPISGDLGGVHAVDGKHASIWDAPNRLSYETSDGGATWKQSANE
jgi:hypothetical protein